jgi:FtsP/CotA-like multicopper oxidase with cupredoxin domain
MKRLSAVFTGVVFSAFYFGIEYPAFADGTHLYRFATPTGSEIIADFLRNPALVMSDGRRLKVTEERRSKDGLLDTSLEMQLAQNKIGHDIRVYTRTYEEMIPGPILRIKRGDTMRITLLVDPNLPSETSDPGEHVEDINTPHGFNITNLHTHGLNVSPRFEVDEQGIIVKSSDNVLLQIPSGVSKDFFYEFIIPGDHPDGTYWYHAHKHGSVAFQFMGGIAGALIIEGPTDEFLEKRGIKEQFLVLQQIRINEDGVVQLEHAGDFLKMPHYTVNGRLKPRIRLKAGEVQRWRFIHAGMSEHMPLELRGLNGGEPQTFYLLAGDGITLPALEPVEQIFMAAGNRVDALVKIEEPGLYFLIKPERDQGFFPGGPVPKELIAIVLVDSQRKDMALPEEQLPSPYYSKLTPIKDDELDPREPDPQRPDEFLPHRILSFGFDLAGFEGANPNGPVKFPKFTMGGRYGLDREDKVVPVVFGDEPAFPADVPAHIRPMPFNPDRVDQMIRHGAVEEWTVLNFTSEDHVFHLHQVPVFVTEVVDPREPPPSGNAVTKPNKWQDVQLVPGGKLLNPQTFEVIPGSMTFRVRFEGDITTSLNEEDVPRGDFVVHCHIVDHEDLGMMQHVRVLPRPESTLSSLQAGLSP